MTISDLLAQLEVLNDLRRPITPERFATPKQLQKINIAIREIVGDEYRIAVLRKALGYQETFTSTSQLYFSDAQGLIKWLWDEEDDSKSKPSKQKSVICLQELKRKLIEIQYVQVIA